MSPPHSKRQLWVRRASPVAAALAIGVGLVSFLVGGPEDSSLSLQFAYLLLALTPPAMRRFPHNRWVALIPLAAMGVTLLYVTQTAPKAAASLVILGVGGAAYALYRSQGWWAAQTAAGIAAGFAFSQWLTYHLAFQATCTAVGLFLTAVSLALEDPDRGIAKLLAKDGPGAVLARRLLPHCLIVPGLLWWARLKLESLGLFRGESGVVMFATLGVVLLIALFATTAFRLEETFEVQQEAEAKLLGTTQLLNYSAKMSALGEMAGNIAHEINNPLSVISGHVEELHDAALETKIDTASVRRCAKTIEDTVNRITKIVTGLRAFSRDAEGDPFQVSPVAEIIDETLDLCRQRFSGHQVMLEVSPIPLGLTLECRKIQISQVLLNLLNNSFDSVLKEKKRWVRLTVTDDGNFVRLAVTDSGQGVPPHLAERIFVPFYTSKKVGEGTGLGLSISKGIISVHGGELTLARVGSRTEFVIRLPKHQPQERHLIAA